MRIFVGKIITTEGSGAVKLDEERGVGPAVSLVAVGLFVGMQPASEGMGSLESGKGGQ